MNDDMTNLPDDNTLDFDHAAPAPVEATYTEEEIKTLDWREHLRLRPGMYIGKLGDGSKSDDGIYVLIKEVADNAIDEFMMGYGRRIDITYNETSVSVRDFGRGIPLGKLVDVASIINTGAKYDNKAFKKSVGLNGVGIKAVNALSTGFVIQSNRDGMARRASFSRAILLEQTDDFPTDEPNGTYVEFTPDAELFRNYAFNPEFIETMVRNYTYLNTGLEIYLNGRRYFSRNGLLDLLKANLTKDPLYPIIHLRGEDIEVAITHANQYGEEYYSFVNGQFTTQGGTHLAAFKESVSRTVKDYFAKNFEYSDIRSGMVAAISVKDENPEFDSQTKTKFTSRDIGPDGPTVAKFVSDFLKKELDDYLHKNLDTAQTLLKKIQESEQARKAMSGITKQARERAKKVNLNNNKLRDCRVHLNDARGDEKKKLASSIFLTEGDSASGSITKIRDVETQAVFSLRGKPLNSYGMARKVVYENEEFNLLQAALNIEEGLEGLRYNNVIIATDADVDGMHIRLLLLTFFLQFFPDLVKKGHVYVLQTPLFRVRDDRAVRRAKKKKTTSADGELKDSYYCYSDQERIDAIARFGNHAEITRFKGLGEISADEFREFIGPDMRLDRVTLRKEDSVGDLLDFYMGKNTSTRANFIIDNLVVEDDSQIS